VSSDEPLQLFLLLVHPLLFGIIAWVFGNIRLLSSGWGIASPLTLRGRFRTGLLIIPHYDIRHVVPITLGLVAALLSAVMQTLRLDIHAQAGLIAAVTLPLALGLPPSYESWRLTSEGRLVPTRADDDLPRRSRHSRRVHR
jgi:hypothetical protein